MNDTVNSKLQTHDCMDEFCGSHSPDFGPTSLRADLLNFLS